jgi:hypothetical protein
MVSKGAGGNVIVNIDYELNEECLMKPKGLTVDKKKGAQAYELRN